MTVPRNVVRTFPVNYGGLELTEEASGREVWEPLWGQKGRECPLGVVLLIL